MKLNDLSSAKEFQGLTVKGKNIEDFITHYSNPTNLGFENSLRIAIIAQSEEYGITTDEFDIESSLFLISDQTSDLRKIFPPEIIVSMSIPALKETSNFFKNLKKDGIDILEDINSKDSHGNTALIWAASKGYSQTAEMLINKDADLNTKNKDGKTALIYAAESGYTEIAAKLIDAGVDLNTQDKHGCTALIYAAYRSFSPQTVAILIEAGVDLNARDKDGKTALICAAEWERTEIAVKLIVAGADVNDLDNRLKINLLSYAATQGNDDLALKLLTSKQTPEKLHALIDGISEEQKLRIVEPIKQAFTELSNQKKGLAAAELIKSFPRTDRGQLQELRQLVKENQGLAELRGDANSAPKIKAVEKALNQLPGRWW